MDIVVAKITNESLLCFPPPSPKQVSFHFGKPMRVMGRRARTLPPNQGRLGTGKSDNDDGTWWGGGRLKDRVPLYMEGRRAIGPVL